MSISSSEYVLLARFLSEHRLPKSAPEPGCQEGLGKAFRRQDGSPFGRCLFGVNTMSADYTAAVGTKPPATDVCRTAPPGSVVSSYLAETGTRAHIASKRVDLGRS
jgi:hypothetical protein